MFDVIGTRFGIGNGSTTFNLPNLVSKFPRGCGSANDVGGSSGADSVTLTTDNLPSHSHGLGSHTHNISGTTDNESAHETFYWSDSHSHSFSNGGATLCINVTSNVETSEGFLGGGLWKGMAKAQSNINSTTLTVSGTCSGDHTHSMNFTSGQASGNTDSTGSNTAFSIIPSYVNFYYIIKY